MNPKPHMSHPKRAARRRRMVKAAKGGEPLATIAIREDLDPGYVAVICRGLETLSLHRAMNVRLALQIVRCRQRGMSYREIRDELQITVGYVGEVVGIAEREGVLTGR